MPIRSTTVIAVYKKYAFLKCNKASSKNKIARKSIAFHLPEKSNKTQKSSKQIKSYTLASLLPTHYESTVGEISHFPKPLWVQFFLK
ncbi:hypothetical protein FCOL_02645 [Flavobacterium columnare ATCC 49512]|uniref:Uncharacterized protein n=1 Tax=Flavobacterium columnare (strain ATCC 49512 / CIP 103533 / TG 44/87) TaxID=1041826 RepID=G8X4E9_FLACA|nr:hypothetical protein FCOL_02645 [Flavobacterium columnare ATCC 49512]